MKHITIIGIGLIGGSLAKTLKATQPDCHITAIDTDADARELMLHENAIDAGYTAIADAPFAACDTLIIATPPHYWQGIAQQLAEADLSRLSLMMDVGSVKAHALTCFARFPAFIACHPIAGREFSGAAYAIDGLFNDKRVILCPHEGHDAAALAAAHQLWESLGAVPTELEAELHDMIYAHMSHVPQCVAYGVALALRGHMPHSNAEGSEEGLRWLRLAGSSPSLWQGIIRHNQHIPDALATWLQLLVHMLTELRTADETQGAPIQLETATGLIPRLVASCLISVVSLAERKHEVSLAPFAGAGFADMSAPAFAAPDDDLARISEHASAVVALLEMLEHTMRQMLLAIKAGDWDAVQQMMQDAQNAYASQLH